MNHRVLRGVVLLLLLAVAVAYAIEATPVPEEFEKLAKELTTNLDVLSSFLNERGAPPPTAYKKAFAELLVASGQRGEELFQNNVMPATEMTLDGLKKLGLRGVTICIPYPLLTPLFPRHEEYTEFYRWVVAAARRRGLAVLVKMSTNLEDPLWTHVRFEYGSQDNAAVIAGMHAMAGEILRNLRPDYLTVVNEPDTTGVNLHRQIEPALYRELIAGILAGQERGATLIGAGAGTWSPLEYFEIAARTPGLDYIDLHIYPINRDWATGKIEQIAALAKTGGKKLACGESWLYKALAEELGGPSVINFPRVVGRDVFSFWRPFDIRFHEGMLRTGAKYDLQFVSFFWMRYYFGNVDYNTDYARYTPAMLISRANEAAGANIYTRHFSALGEWLRGVLTQ